MAARSRCPRTARTTSSRLAVVAATCFALFVLVAVLIRTGWTPLTHLDTRVVHTLHDNALAHRGQLRLWRDISTVFAPTVLRIAAAVGAVAWYLRRRILRPPLVLALTALGTFVLSSLSKTVVDRNRPHFAHPVAHAAGQSYPSGHALTSFVIIGAAIALSGPRVRKFVAVPGVLVIAAVGYSRMILGVHYLSDVVGGWLLGLAWLCLVLLVLQRLPRRARVRA